MDSESAGKMSDHASSESQPIESFQWDDASQLFFHASTGFYHDPCAGWYYSSRDGRYYKFENENYVPWDSDKIGDMCGVCGSGRTARGNVFKEESSMDACSPDHDIADSGVQLSAGANDDESKHLDFKEDISNSENANPHPPSEWIEETLINIYLSGYSNPATNGDIAIPIEMDSQDDSPLLAENNYELEEGEWIPDDTSCVEDEGKFLPEGIASWDEENWRAQYGQVNQPEEVTVANVPAMDLWDWSMVTETKKEKVARLVGRLMKQSVKLHPSLPFSRSLYRTAPICEVYLDLVRVATGKVYKLRNPCAKYLASLSVYDSSNPTRDWGFPELSFPKQVTISLENSESESAAEGSVQMKSRVLLDQKSFSEKQSNHQYRDRAAARRALHGGFGVGPGQKRLPFNGSRAPSSPPSASPNGTADVSLNHSFGVGSYARNLLEKMGWKEGEALGKAGKGLVEPLQAVGNKSGAGLGWTLGGRKLH